ncbi:ATP-binding protein [Streptomyces sp. NPDC102259]|uniref:ATP-binding protein n=1 Tax=Streptomyces sp. NPDC102259 TaxID=3366148 RepID=UPI0038306C0B
MNGEPTISSCEVRLPAVTASIALARQWVHDCVEGFGGPLRRHPVIQTAELLVSELITNAIRHGADPPLIRVTWTDQLLRIAVSDDSDRQPRTRVTANCEPGGFGLQLLERLALRWGVAPVCPANRSGSNSGSIPELTSPAGRAGPVPAACRQCRRPERRTNRPGKDLGCAFVS